MNQQDKWTMIMKSQWNESKYWNEIIKENRMRIFIDPIFIIFFYLKETERSANLVSPIPLKSSILLLITIKYLFRISVAINYNRNGYLRHIMNFKSAHFNRSSFCNKNSDFTHSATFICKPIFSLSTVRDTFVIFLTYAHICHIVSPIFSV